MVFVWDCSGVVIGIALSRLRGLGLGYREGTTCGEGEMGSVSESPFREPSGVQ